MEHLGRDKTCHQVLNERNKMDNSPRHLFLTPHDGKATKPSQPRKKFRAIKRLLAQYLELFRYFETYFEATVLFTLAALKKLDTIISLIIEGLLCLMC